MKLIVFLIGIFSLSVSAQAKKYEKDYQESWCSGKGVTEFVLPDKTRVDCLTDSHAIEFDWAKKWAEAIGQSLYYSFATNKKAGIVIILKSEKDKKHLTKLYSVIEHNKLEIDVWLIKDFSQ